MNDTAISQADKVKALTDQLKEGVQEVFSSGNYAEYLSTLSRFHRYSFRNSMLIYLQNPDATRVAGFNAWKTLGRSINKGEKGLQILAPSPYKITIDATHDENGNLLPEPVKKQVQRMAFKVTYVFDVSQTSGKELPELAHRLTGDVGKYDHLMAALQKISPYPIAFDEIARAGTNGFCDYEAQRIVIRKGVSQEQAVKTTVHEIAHALLHSNKTGLERDRQAFEVQAESVAYVVCQHFGIDSSQYSFGYVAGWSGSVQLEVLEQSLTVIQNGALQIIDSAEMELIERSKEIVLSEHAFDEDNYLHFVATVDNRDYEGLFRVHDPANGKSMQIVSIDYGYMHSAFEAQWYKLTESLREYSQVKYGELITREDPDLAARMRDIGQIPYYVDGFSEDSLMWKDITTGKTHGYDGWDLVASDLDNLNGLHQTELTEKMIAVGLEPYKDTSDKGQNTLAWLDTSTGEVNNAGNWQEVSDILTQRMHEDELYTLWQGETNDPRTQEWRSLLKPAEQTLVDKWDKAWGDDMKAVNALVEENRVRHNARQHDMMR